AVERARGGGGPSLLHVRLMRFYGHFEGDAMTYRGPDEVARFRAEHDSLKIFRGKVTAAGLLKDGELDGVDAQVAKLIDDGVAAAETAALPTQADLATDVYAHY